MLESILSSWIAPHYHRDCCNCRFPGELLILGYLRSPPKDTDTSVMVRYWSVFSVELGTYRLIISIAIYCAPFDVIGGNIMTTIPNAQNRRS